MFSEIKNFTSVGMEAFSEVVRDEFGRAIIRDVFEPILVEIESLIRMNEHMERTINEINLVNEELQSLGINVYVP